jgi:4-hydroxy-3-methylbut-2-enyl diphosphate reductase
VEAGKTVVFVASDRAHDEAVSICEQVETGVKVVTIAELENLVIDGSEKTVLMTQTTLSMLEVGEALAKLQKKYPVLTLVPHLCAATTERQRAVQELTREVKTVVVVGAPHSSNSNRLKEVARQAGARAYIVDSASELKKEWFAGEKIVGVTAGASTPPQILEAVIKKLKSF